MKNFLAAVALIAASALHISHAAADRLGPTAQHPAVSPTGTEVAFTADFDGKSRIWAAALDGSRLRKLSSLYDAASNANDFEAQWSPDARRLTYASGVGNTSEIWVMNSDGTNAQRITALGAHSASPVWSPDGARILFISDKDGTKDVWSVNIDGSQPRKLIDSPAEENNVRFSPAGDRIVFSRTTGDTASLVVANANGSGVRTLTSGNFQDWEPSWSSRGIAFASNREASDTWKIWVVQPDGSGVRKLADMRAHDPSWLPDGRLVFTDESMNTKAVAGLSIVNPVSGVKQPVVEVQGFQAFIDVRPGKTTNFINPRSSGRVAVAILSTRSFDATTQVAQSSLTFGRTGSEESLAYCAKPRIDVNSDGLPDLVCRFSTRQSGFQAGNTVGVLRFTDTRGLPWEARDVISIVADEDPNDFNN